MQCNIDIDQHVLACFLGVDSNDAGRKMADVKLEYLSIQVKSVHTEYVYVFAIRLGVKMLVKDYRQVIDLCAFWSIGTWHVYGLNYHRLNKLPIIVHSC